MALQSFHVQGFGASPACLHLHQVPFTLHAEQFLLSPSLPRHPSGLTTQALPTTSQVPLPHLLHLQSVLKCAKALHCLGNEMTIPQLNSQLDSKLPLQRYLPLLPLMHSHQSAVG